jgi:light-regulated signal transduction histidine kinase (bacteriophytochrome)
MIQKDSKSNANIDYNKKYEYTQLINQLTNKSFFQLQTFIAWVKLISDNLQLNFTQSHIKDTVKQAILFNRNDLDSKEMEVDIVCNIDLVKADHIQLAIALACFLFSSIRTGVDKSSIRVAINKTEHDISIHILWQYSDNEQSAIKWLTNPKAAQEYDEQTFRLWIGKKIIEAHKGSVIIETDPEGSKMISLDMHLPFTV